MRGQRMAVLVAACLISRLAGADAWVLQSETDGIVIHNKVRPDSTVEIRAVGVIDAPPPAVWALLRDYAAYKDNLPYTTETVVIRSETDGAVTYVYSIVGLAPLLYDYNIRIVDESAWHDGKGYFKTSWTLWDGPGARSGPWYVRRLRENQGYWQLEPVAAGRQTRATYWLWAIPPGAFLAKVAAWGNNQAMPQIYRALRERSLQAPYRQFK